MACLLGWLDGVWWWVEQGGRGSMEGWIDGQRALGCLIGTDGRAKVVGRSRLLLPLSL